MKESSLLILLKSFSKKEFKEFLLFVKSPYFNNEKVLIHLSELIYDSFPEFEKDMEEVFKLLYPDKKYNYSLIRNIYSDLKGLAEEFLSIENYRSEKIKMRKGLLTELNKRNIPNQFLKQRKIIAELLSQIKIQNGKYYFYKYELETEVENFLIKNRDQYIKKEIPSQNILDNLMIFFLIEYTYFSAESNNRKKIIQGSGPDLKFENEIENLLQKDIKLLEIPYIKVYYYIFKIIKYDSEQHFHLLKSFAENDLSMIMEKDRKEIFTVLTNFSYLKVLSGDLKYLKEQFDISRTSVEMGIHKSSNGFIPHVQFMNVVITGLEINEIDSVNKFIQKYSIELKQEFRIPTLHFCSALIFFHNKEYDKSKEELALVTIEDYSFKQQLRSLYLKIYFETNDYESFYFHIDSYKHFISGNKLIHELVRMQINDYINYTKRLFDFKNNINSKDEFELKKLENDVNRNTSLVNKKWILEKIREVSSGKADLMSTPR